MSRPLAVAVLALAAVTFSGCSDREDTLAPRAVRAGYDGKTIALVVEADAPVGRLVVTIDDELGHRDVELRRSDKDGLLAGAIDMLPGEKAQLAFRGFGAEDKEPAYEGEGTLVVDGDVTPQQEFALAGAPGAEEATVRIGTYRLALTPSVIVNTPGREVRIQAVLLDAHGEPHQVGKEALAWMPTEWNKDIGDFGFDYRDWLIDILWIPEKWYAGTIDLCTKDIRFCGKLTLTDPNPVVQVTTGTWHSCALRKSGTVKCWGDNSLGALGKNASAASQLSNIAFKSISAGAYHTCGIEDYGIVQCWGSNQFGQLGVPLSVATSAQPMQPTLPAAAKQVSAGRSHTCALLVNGESWCWGGNWVGQLGDGSAMAKPAVTTSPGPVLVQGGLTFTTISAGADQTCGLTAAGVAWCWGGDTQSESGFNPNAADKCNYRSLAYYPYTTSWDACAATPRQVQTTVTFAGIGAGEQATCAHTAAGTGYCWGHPYMQSPPASNLYWVPRTQAGFPTWKRLMAADSYECGIDAGDMIQCMGQNGYGQTGTGNVAYAFYTMSPVAVQDTWTDMDAGSFHGCGVRAQGFMVSCWGENSKGQLGHVTPSGMSRVPLDVTVGF